MSACTFTIPFTGDTSIVLEKAKKAVENQSGSFDGDGNHGNFQVSFFGQEIIGGYTVAGNELNIVIESKPFMVPCNAIESFLTSKIV
ncbi:MAG: hypothetical protein WD135_00350 [Ferruginibacter sp.]